VEPVLTIGRFATGGLTPDLILIYDLPPETGVARRQGDSDRIEQRDLEYHRRVREGFLSLHDAFEGKVAVIDASPPPDVLARETLKTVMERLSLAGGGRA
jgi:dTMP kinase